MDLEVIPRQGIKRYRSVIVATLLQLLQGAGLFGYGIYQVYGHGWGLDISVGGWRYIPFPLFESLSSGMILTVLGLFTILVAIAFWFLRNWAWTAAMTMQGLGLFVGLINYIRQRPNYIGMLLAIIIVLYLNNKEVQESFRRGTIE